MKRLALGILAAAALTGATACSDDSDAGVPVAIEYVSGNQSGAPGTLLPNPLVVEVLTRTGEGVANIELRWEVVQGSGDLDQTVTYTDAEGRATNTYRLGNEGGTTEGVRVRALGLDIGQVVFTLTVEGDGGGGGEL